VAILRRVLASSLLPALLAPACAATAPAGPAPGVVILRGDPCAHVQAVEDVRWFLSDAIALPGGARHRP
jgi:hypothetical protein